MVRRFRPLSGRDCSAGFAGVKHKIVVCCKLRAPSIASIHSRRPTWPVHQLPIRLPPVKNHQNRRQGTRGRGCAQVDCAVALVASCSPSCSSRRQASGIRRGVVGTRGLAWLCGFFFLVRGGLLRCFELAIGDNGLMRMLKL